MNHILEKYARDYLKENLAKLGVENFICFKRMYAPKNVDWGIPAVVDGMDVDTLDWAMIQVENTLKKRGIE